jgi:hypothetical protein
MKGQPRLLMTLVGDHGRLELVLYLDGSHGIIRNGNLLGVWEPSEKVDCIKTFAKLGNFNDGLPKLIVQRADLSESMALDAVRLN